MSVDGYMNISLEKTEEYVDGKLRRSYGEAFVRGNNGSFLFHNNKMDSSLIYLSALYFRLMNSRYILYLRF